MHMFRFRSFNQLLGEHEELKRRTIYFAAPEQLNDPLEGFRDIYWSGDHVVWRNLFKHYLLCVERSLSLLHIFGEEHKITPNMIPIFGSELDLPTPEYKELFKNIKGNFFQPEIEEYVKKIAKKTHRVRRDELAFHLRNVHILAIESALKAYRERGLSKAEEFTAGDPIKGVRHLLESQFFENSKTSNEQGTISETLADAIYKATRLFSTQTELMARYKSQINESESNRALVFLQFPDLYLNLIEALVYPNWYTACFTSDCKNSAAWGYYAAGHTGACLIFKTDSSAENQYLSLKGSIGYSSNGPIIGDVKFNFHKIEYIDGFGEIDFFQHLGQPSGQTLATAWYRSDDEALSECGTSVLGADDEWRRKYWETFYRDITKKTKHWQEENEYRLIISSLMSGPKSHEDRLYTYHPSALEGVIFGIKSSAQDKVAAIKIITENCRETQTTLPKFFQATYSPQSKSIEHFELNII